MKNAACAVDLIKRRPHKNLFAGENDISVKHYPNMSHVDISGKLVSHIKNVKSAMGKVKPPKKGKPGHLQYKRMITDLIGDLHFHLSNLD